MEKSFLIFVLSFFSFFIYAQNETYNTQKGYLAEGYDVVSYFSNKAIKGKKEFKTTYNNTPFLFSSEKNRSKFLKSPKKYIPQYGGFCAYAIAKNNKKVSIDPETFEIRNDKLYLFYNSWGMNTLKSWLKENPEELVKKGNKNW